VKQLRYAATGRLADLSPTVRSRIVDRSSTSDAGISSEVGRIIDAVRSHGDAALRALALEFDRVQLVDLEVPRERCLAALGSIDRGLRSAMEAAARNIERVHRAWLPEERTIEVEPGVVIRRRPSSLRRVGVYAPGGSAVYPSSVLMGVIPARVAGVPEIILCSPPSSTGIPSDAVLAAAALAGATRVFALGGAGAIAALALGTRSVPRVETIVGPGNAYVTEAKLQLAREVRTDLPAGPSEIMIVADDLASPKAVAAELCAQAEHGCDSAAVALLIGAGVLPRVERALASQVPALERAAIVQSALERHGALLEVESVSEALHFIEEYAPEHLLLMTRDAAAFAERVTKAGSVFINASSSVALGDYMTGANHVLPTAGFGRSRSGLSTEDFVRWTVVQHITPAAASRLAPRAVTLAIAEGLAAHAAAARIAGEGSL
jgi:histidinol dehydrogenase